MTRDLIQNLLVLPSRDGRITGCQLIGSYSTGKADQWSDIDLELSIDPADQLFITQQLPSYINEIEPVVAHCKILAGETLGATNWCVPHDSFFFFLKRETALEIVVETGVAPLNVKYGRYRPVLLALWMVNFPRWAKAIRRGQKEGIEVQKQNTRTHLIHIGLESIGASLKEAMSYLEEHGHELCSSAGEEYPSEVVKAYRVWIKAMVGY